MLTYRCRQLVRKMVSAKQPLLVKDLANEFQVSARAIKYDLENIRLWLQRDKSSQIKLIAKPNRGIWLEGCDACLEQLDAELLMEKSAALLNQEERIRFIAMKLLSNEHYLTIQSLADETGVSRNTVIGDSKEVELFLQSWNITLQRTAHRGLRITAPERKRRWALSYILQSFLDNSDISWLLQNLTSDTHAPPHFERALSWFMLKNGSIALIYNTIRNVIKQVQAKPGEILDENTILGLFVRLCVAVQRIQTGYSLLQQQVPAYPAESVDAFLMDRIRNECYQLGMQLHLEFSEAEIRFVCQPWLDRAPVSETNETALKKAVSMAESVAALITDVSKATGITFQDDANLFDNLLAHCTDRVAKYRQRVLTPNPLTAEIARNYSDIFNAVKRSSRAILGQQGVFLNDSDIAYLVLHFQAVRENQTGQSQYRALVVCGTGRGNARLLQTRLENEIRGLRIIGCCSVLELSQTLETNPTDLIISILPVTVDHPTVIIHAIPTQKDFDNIYKALKKLKKDHPLPLAASPAGESNFFNTLMETRSHLNRRDLPLLETMSQEIINQGFQVAMQITTEFTQYLTETSAAGLMIHLLLMINRLAFDSPYLGVAEAKDDSSPANELKQRVSTTLRQHYPHLPDQEITAIMRYFSISTA